jgi:hypothetical protein
MSKTLLALGGFAAGTLAVVAITQYNNHPTKTMPVGSGMGTTAAMTQNGSMMGAGSAPRTTTRAVALNIRHVRRGCHVWNQDGRQAAMMRISLPRGGRLSILDQDLDAHKLVQMSGPRLMMPATMTMMDTASLRFMRPGVYRLATKTVEVPGAEMPEAPTVGPDNHLQLLVTVA